MREMFTNAAEIARAVGVNDKSLRNRLRRDHPEFHTHGSWKAPVGSNKALLMERVAKEMRNATRP